MNETVLVVLSLSLSGSILAGLVFALKPLIRHRFSKSVQYYIWVVVILRLVLPLSFEGSLMNDVFHHDKPPAGIGSPVAVQPVDGTQEGIVDWSALPDVRENAADGDYNGDADHNGHFRDLFSRYALYLWILGAIMALAVNLTGYAYFIKHLKKANKPATQEQNRILTALTSGRRNVRLARNRFATTPMLTGVLRPLIIIPDIDFDEKQLRNILLHELTHLRRFDIAIKWMTMVAASIHWFNPFVYLVRKETNHACELACDEAVVKNLNAEERQAYGDTLISSVSANKYPMGMLQATMCEEKETIKERLVSIMKYNRRPKYTILISILLLIAVIGGAVMLGACSGKIGQEVAGGNQSGNSGGDAGGDAVDLKENDVAKIGDSESDIYIKFESKGDFPGKYKDQFSNHIAGLFTDAYIKYYQVKGFEFSNVGHTLTDTGLEVTFFLKMIVQNYYRDPDTVEYIKQAKENNSKHYQQLYDEYNQPKESNFDMKFTVELNDGEMDVDSIQLFTNVHPKGVEYAPISEDFFP